MIRRLDVVKFTSYMLKSDIPSDYLTSTETICRSLHVHVQTFWYLRSNIHQETSKLENHYKSKINNLRTKYLFSGHRNKLDNRYHQFIAYIAD